MLNSHNDRKLSSNESNESNEGNESSRSRLTQSVLSFYDPFHTVRGIPAFLLRSEDTPTSSSQRERASFRLSTEEGFLSEALLSHPSLITCCSFSKDGRRLASGHSSGNVTLWDVEHGKLLKCKELHDVPICSICFRDETNDILLSSDRKGICIEWNTNGSNDRVTRMNCSTLWKDNENDIVDIQSSSFFMDGGIVVFPVMIGEVLRRDFYSEASSMPSMKLFVVDTIVLPDVRCKTILKANIQLPDIVTRMEISPDGKGLLVGFTDCEMEEGYVVLWPNFATNPESQVRLQKGTLGSWEPNSRWIVTWTVPEVPFPQNNDGCCAFLWDVEALENRSSLKSGDSNGLQPVKPITLKNPHGRNVLWCRFVLDQDGKSRMVMGELRKTLKLLFWDIETRRLTHIIPTGITNNDTILGNRACWKMCWAERHSIKGLEPLAITQDRKWLGAVSGHDNQAVILDTSQGVEIMNLALPPKLSKIMGADVDLLFSPFTNKVAMIGYTNILVFCPPVQVRSEMPMTSLRSHEMVALKYSDASNTQRAVTKLQFSANGEALAVLHVGSSLLHVWSLLDSRYKVITEDLERSFHASSWEFVDFAFAVDFNFQRKRSLWMVTYTSSDEILIWDCGFEKPFIIGVVCSQQKGSIRSIGLLSGNDYVVICDRAGNLSWYQLLDRFHNAETSVSEETRSNFKFNSSRSCTGESVSWMGTSMNIARTVLCRFKTVASSIREKNQLRLCGGPVETKSAQGSHSCRFSADCRIGVLMPDLIKAFVWDLEQRVCLRSVNNHESSSILRSMPFGLSLPLSGSADLHHSILNDSRVLSEVDPAIRDSIKKRRYLDSDKSLLLSENEDVFIIAGYSPGRRSRSGSIKMTANLFQNKETTGCNALYVVHRRRPEKTRKISGKKLLPWKGMAMSSDGRFVACITANKKCGHILVWSAYACDALIPSFYGLDLRDVITTKQIVVQNIMPLLKQFGVNLLNYVHPNGETLIFEAVDSIKDEVVDVALEFVAKKQLKVSLESARRGNMNVVELALERRSPEIASKLMKYLMERVTYDPQLARILKKCLVLLNKNYPKIFIETLHHPKLFSLTAELRMAEVFLGRETFVETTSNLLLTTEFDAEKIWKRRSKEDRKVDEDPITFAALSKVLPYPNACQVGVDGLLRPMLVNSASHLCFASFPVKAIVMHKWRKYARRRLIWEFAHSSAVLLFFTIYCFLLGYRKSGEDEDKVEYGDNDYKSHEIVISTAVALSICWVLSIPKLFGEIYQAYFYWRDYGVKGISHWFQSAWNWMEVLCALIILFVIPLCQYDLPEGSTKTSTLTSIVAVVSILLWSKFLYYARPFRKTGPLVIIVSAIAKDIMPFLLLAASVMFGFAVAFYVLYRESRGNGTDSIKSFSSFPSTLFTVVAYVFGDFDSDDLFDAPQSKITVILFVLYMVIVMIILLNMMIAIMGDSFNRIKSSEETRFIKARAEAIDDIDSQLSTRQKESLHEDMGTYLHVAVPKYRHDKILNSVRRQPKGQKKDKSSAKLKRILYIVKTLTKKGNDGKESVDSQNAPTEDNPEDVDDRQEEVENEETSSSDSDSSSDSSTSIESGRDSVDSIISDLE